MNRREFLKGAALTAAVAPTAGWASSGKAVAGSVIDYSREMPVKVRTDVMIAGGGAAGVAAAVAARKAGAKVFLAEAFTCFGGLGTGARVPLFMQWGDGVRDLACGFGTRFRDRLKAAGGMCGSGGAFDFEVVKREYDRSEEQHV
jgi:NADPH-dependent 2,4-dienoyl-CoA reductase/sulfur reductase-like enzyme